MIADTTASKWKRFKGWMCFSILLSTGLVLLNAVAKIPERQGSEELHWLVGTSSLQSFVIPRLSIIIGVSLAVSLVATLAGAAAPYGGKLQVATKQPPTDHSDHDAVNERHR